MMLVAGGTKNGKSWLSKVPTLLAGLAMVLAGCTPTDTGGQRQPGQPRAPSGPKTITMAIHEPIDVLSGGGGGNIGSELGNTFNASLTYYDPSGTLLPKLAEKIPSIFDGDWKTSPDGSMEVTWKLKPNLKWHDGTSLTAQDFAFAVRMFKDRGSPFSVPRSIRFVDETATPDDQTLVLRYRSVFNGAAVANVNDFPVVPRHLLTDLYEQQGIEAVANSPVWITEWVGMGPFRVTGHAPGIQLEGEAFADYVLGRPQIDRIIVKIILDVRTMVANLLAGELDAVGTGPMEAADAAVLKQQWEQAGRGTVGVNQNRLRQVQLQFRDPSLPWASDVRVRQAALHLIDRQAIVDSIIHGLTSVADVALLPGNPLYGQLERRGIPKYPFDRGRGERLLDEAGWPRGADGVRRNASGTVLTWNPAVSGEPDLPEVLVFVDGFRAAGIASEPDLIPDSLGSTDKNMRRATAHSITRSAGVDHSYWDRFLPSQISSQDSRWRGSNTGGYTNPTFDALFDQWRVALDSNARSEREVEMHKLLLDQLAYLPLFYNVDIFAYRKGLTGPKPNVSPDRNVSRDIHTWRLE